MAGELSDRLIEVASRAAARNARLFGRIADAVGMDDTVARLRVLMQALDTETDPLIAASLRQTALQMVQQMMAKQNAGA